MMQLLHGRELAKAIVAMFDADERPRCAVAFWGPEMAKRARKVGALVILDLSMGGTTRNALCALGVTPEPMPSGTGDRVRVLDRLHAKLYLTRDAAVVGSANASGNALGVGGGEPRLVEAGVLIRRDDEPKAFADVEALWRKLLAASRAIRPDDLERAPLIAASAASRDHGGDARENGASILEALLARPGDFVSTSFAFGDHDMSKPELDEVEGDYEEERGEPPQAHGRSVVCTCRPGDPVDAALRATLRVIVFWFGRGPDIYAYHDVVRAERDGRVSFFGRRNWPKVSVSVGLAGIGKEAAWATDRALAREMCDIDGQPVGERFVAISQQAAASWLERRSERARNVF